jgi:glycerol-3-phosphate cytidylyltransferase
MKTVLTYGTFDLFHIGHVNLLNRAKELGDRLIVAVSTDDFNRVKGKMVVIPYDHRAAIVRNQKSVDLVIPETGWEQKERDISQYAVSTLVMGDDWKGKFDELSHLCRVVYLPRTCGVSSSELKSVLAPLGARHLTDLKLALDTVVRIAAELA